MTVRELIIFLETLPPGTRVFEERQSELRELHPEDMSFDYTAQGHPIDSAMYSQPEWAELLTTPIVILRAWS